jgi:hypothetical protein
MGYIYDSRRIISCPSFTNKRIPKRKYSGLRSFLRVVEVEDKSELKGQIHSYAQYHIVSEILQMIGRERGRGAKKRRGFSWRDEPLSFAERNIVTTSVVDVDGMGTSME